MKKEEKAFRELWKARKFNDPPEMVRKFEATLASFVDAPCGIDAEHVVPDAIPFIEAVSHTVVDDCKELGVELVSGRLILYRGKKGEDAVAELGALDAGETLSLPTYVPLGYSTRIAAAISHAKEKVTAPKEPAGYVVRIPVDPKDVVMVDKPNYYDEDMLNSGLFIETEVLVIHRSPVSIVKDNVAWKGTRV